MDRNTVFTKTAKGITQVNQRSASLSKDLMKILKVIDGKSNFGQIMEKVEMDKGSLEKALNTLIKDGYSRVFETRKEEADPFAAEDDFDFTAPGKMAPGQTQRVVAAAANDISELVRQQSKVEADKKARGEAQEAARAKAKVEAESRAKLEAEAKARKEAEERAMEQARRAKEASERARVELEAKMREEEARKRALAEQQARLTVEQKAKEEEESRRLAELRVKAEREAKALAEARAKAEAEAQALAKARAEAEAAAKRQATQATNAEAEMRARLKDEIEGRIRAEMEELLRNEFEEKTREEMKGQILEEARMAARAELEDRMREERETLAKAETEARTKAEGEQRERADREAKLRAEAEARAAKEAEARAKVEEELRRARAMEARSRAEAEAKAREQDEELRRAKAMEVRAREEAEAKSREQQERLEAERQAKIEAQARVMVEAEEREKREKELKLTIEAERRGKQEAEMRAKIEAKARETVETDTRARVQAEIEQDMTKRAELEGKAQAKAYMEAKSRAEQEEDAKMRADQDRKAREIADILRTKVEPDSVAPDEGSPAVRRRPRKRGSPVKAILMGLVAIVVIGIALLHVVPLRGVADKIERAMAAWLHDDVSITTVKFSMIPTPHLKFESLAVGKQLDAKASRGRIFLDVSTIFSDRVKINSLELDDVSISAEAVRRILTWGKVEGKRDASEIDSIKLRGVKLAVKPAVDAFDAVLTFTRDGALKRAYLNQSTAWSLTLSPQQEKGIDVDFSARNWTLPVGAAIPVGDVKLKGTLTGDELVVPEFEADAMEGKVNGTLRVNWTSGVKMESDLNLAKLSAQQLVGSFTKDIGVTGKLDGNFNVASEGPSVEQLFAAPRAQGKFKLSEGSISNVDLVAVMQSEGAGQRAGVTKFAELTGEFGSAEHRAAFRQVSLQGGVLRGNGNIDVGANSALAGHLALEIRSQVAQDRGAFSVSGTVARPIIRRGG